MRLSLPIAPIVLALAGCGTAEPELADVTWHQDVAPIVVERCSGCHRDGGIGPFPLETYEQAKNFSGVILPAIQSGAMPPFLAQETDTCVPRLPWQHDLRLSAEEKALVERWVDAGSPEGDAATAVEPNPPALVDLEREDVVLQLPEPIVVEGTTDLHTCLILDPALAEDSYVVGRLITSGNEKVLHHVVSYLAVPGTNGDGTLQTKADLEAALVAETGAGIGERYDCFGGVTLDTVGTEMLDAWAPGGLPNLAPPGSGQPMAKDSLVILDIHYHPPGSGSETDTDTKLSLMLADETPEMISQIVLLGNFPGPFDSEFGVGDLLVQPGESAPEFVIPADSSDHVEEMTWQWKLPPGLELAVYGVGTHMHYVGRDMQIDLERPAPAEGDVAEECLIRTPAWDFNWQRAYYYDAAYEDLPVMRNGDILRMKCTFDNTMANPFLQAALGQQGLESPIEVRLGEDTLDEMCLGAIAIVYPNY